MASQDADHGRRDLLRGVGATGVAALIGLGSGPADAEPPPETTRIRLARFLFDVSCVAPQWVAEDLLRAEGFTSVEYVTARRPLSEPLAAGEFDLTLNEAFGVILALDAGKPIVALGGIHGGCYELVGSDRIRTIRDLKGTRVAVLTPARRAFVSIMASYVGLNPARDITFVSPSPPEALQLLATGGVDAFLGFPPEPQELRAKGIGHPVVNTATDRPWSQYFCCMAVANREWVLRHPVAAKRALRALVKATDLCAAEPERVARSLVDRGFVKNHEYTLQALREIPYRRWREYDSADTIRFYALRMHEAGIIKTSPQKLIAQGTDWRFVNELKRELKG